MKQARIIKRSIYARVYGCFAAENIVGFVGKGFSKGGVW
jgi:hypothetical protein